MKLFRQLVSNILNFEISQNFTEITFKLHVKTRFKVLPAVHSKGQGFFLVFISNLRY